MHRENALRKVQTIFYAVSWKKFKFLAGSKRAASVNGILEKSWNEVVRNDFWKLSLEQCFHYELVWISAVNLQLESSVERMTDIQGLCNVCLLPSKKNKKKKMIFQTPISGDSLNTYSNLLKMFHSQPKFFEHLLVTSYYCWALLNYCWKLTLISPDLLRV